MDLRQLITPTMPHRLCYNGSVVGSYVAFDVGSRVRSEVGSRVSGCQIECLVSPNWPKQYHRSNENCGSRQRHRIKLYLGLR